MGSWPFDTKVGKLQSIMIDLINLFAIWLLMAFQIDGLILNVFYRLAVVFLPSIYLLIVFL